MHSGLCQRCEKIPRQRHDQDTGGGEFHRVEVVIVADTLDEGAEALERFEPDPALRYFIDASADDDAPHAIGVHEAFRE
jgi:hypothetical protein